MALDQPSSSLLGDCDPRKAGLRRGLCQLSNEQLVKALGVPNVVLDTWNYCDGNFCPLAVAMGLHETMADPTHEKVLAELEARGFKVNNTRGIKGDFYTTDRDRDWRLLAQEIILERGKRRLVPCIFAVHMKEGQEPRVLLIQRAATTKYPHQWCIPGGKMEEGESVVECAHREFEEETGIRRPAFQRLEFVREVDSPTVADLRFSIFVVRFYGPNPPPVAIEPSFEGYGWFTKKDTQSLQGVMSPAGIVVGWDALTKGTAQ